MRNFAFYNHALSPSPLPLFLSLAFNLRREDAQKKIRVRKTRVGAKNCAKRPLKFSSLLFDFLFFFISLFPSLSPYSSLLPFSLLLFSSLIIYISLSSLFLFSSFSFFSILFSILPLFSFSLSLPFVLLIYHYLSAFLPSCSDEDGTGKAFLHIS